MRISLITNHDITTCFRGHFLHVLAPSAPECIVLGKLLVFLHHGVGDGIPVRADERVSIFSIHEGLSGDPSTMDTKKGSAGAPMSGSEGLGS